MHFKFVAERCAVLQELQSEWTALSPAAHLQVFNILLPKMKAQCAESQQYAPTASSRLKQERAERYAEESDFAAQRIQQCIDVLNQSNKAKQ